MERTEIEAAVRALVADSLALSPAEVALGSRLTKDLGADSLDLIDVIFRLETKLGTPLRGSELDFLSRVEPRPAGSPGEAFLSRETVERASAWLPELAKLEDPARVTARQLFSLVTVGTLCLLVERRLAEVEGRSP